MPTRGEIPGLKRIMRGNRMGWWWAASQLHRDTAGFKPRTICLWRGLGKPSPLELMDIKRRAAQLSIDLREWLLDPSRTGRSRRGSIYFIRLDDKVKIGFSNDVERRLTELQTSSPHKFELLLVLPGSLLTEKQLHRQFRAYRTGGEWFRFDPPIAAFVRAEQARAKIVAFPGRKESLNESRVQRSDAERSLGRGLREFRNFGSRGESR